MKKGILFAGILAISVCVSAVCVPVGVCRADDFLNCWSESYFEHHPMTIQELTQRYGQPSKIVDLKGGERDYIYKKFEKDAMMESTRHFIIKDGKVIKSFLKD